MTLPAVSGLSRPEKELNDIPLRLLVASMRSAREQIQRRIAEALADGKPVSAYWQAREREISKVYDEMIKIEQSYLDKNIPDEFRDAKNLARDYLAKIGIKRGKARDLFQINAIQAIIEDAMSLFKNAAAGGMNQVRQLFRATQQRLISELAINNAVAAGMIESNTITGVKSALEKSLIQKLVKDGRVLTTNTITGATRSFEPEYYAEMVARTRTREAQSLGVVNSCLEFGVDLVKVSSHNTISPQCIPHEGKIYSISGSTAGYEKYEGNNRVGYHPNCVHVITPYVINRERTVEPPPIQMIQ